MGRAWLLAAKVRGGGADRQGSAKAKMLGARWTSLTIARNAAGSRIVKRSLAEIGSVA
jgi:hypothetical protein